MMQFCVALSVRGALRKTNAQLRREMGGCVRSGGRLLESGEDIREALMDELAAGRAMLPIGPCDNFDPKTGCRGHAAVPDPPLLELDPPPPPR